MSSDGYDGYLEEKLQSGIRAAKAGDKATARKLLEEVIAEDPDSELALMWLASTVTSTADRRMYLQRVVRINPDNQRARDALRHLSGNQSQAVTFAPPADEPRPARSARQNIVEESSESSPFGQIMLIVVAVLVIGGGGMFLLNLLNSNNNNANTTLFINTPEPTAIPNTPLPTDPVGIVVQTRNPPTLPATFTPTATATETYTPTPTVTPFPIADFQALLSVRDPNQTVPDLFRIDGAGGNPQLISENVSDVIYDLSGEKVILVKDVTYEPSEEDPDGGTVSELFVGSAENPADAEQVTFLKTHNAVSPSFAPRANQIVFVSDYDGDNELWILDLESRLITQLTFNEADDRDPDWSPDGTRLVFASDRDFPGFAEIYMLEFVITEDGAQLTGDDSPNIFTRVTNDQGSSYQPRWSADGGWITYVNDTEGDGDIYLMDKDGQRSQFLTINDRGAEDKNPTFTPDRRYIAFISNREGEVFQAYLISFNGRELLRLTQSESIVTAIDYRPMLIFRFIE